MAPVLSLSAYAYQEGRSVSSGPLARLGRRSPTDWQNGREKALHVAPGHLWADWVYMAREAMAGSAGLPVCKPAQTVKAIASELSGVTELDIGKV
jgi:hypothetical protein